MTTITKRMNYTVKTIVVVADVQVVFVFKVYFIQLRSYHDKGRERADVLGVEKIE